MSKPQIHLPSAPAPLTPLVPARAPEPAVVVDKPGRTRSRHTSEGTGNSKGIARATDSQKQKGAERQLFSIGSTVKKPVVMAFSRQVGSFLEAGISMIETLESVHDQIGSTPMQRVIAKMIETIQRGGSFSEAVSAHPKVFPGFYRAMVRSAEFTGKLDEVLTQLATYLERDIAAKRQVKSALTYPIVVLVVATAAMVLMSVFVLPKFAGMYRGLGASLPLPTRMLLGFTDVVQSSGPLIVAGFATMALAVLLVLGGARGKRRRDRLALRTPVVGSLYHLISVERFCRVLAALTKAGVPLPDAIEMSADSTNNSTFSSKVAQVRETLIRGGGLSAPLDEAGILPTAAAQMIRVGERTGTLSHQLSRSAAYYEREVAYQMKRATDLFQPLVILLVGGIVGFVAIAQVAAMYSIFGQIQG